MTYTQKCSVNARLTLTVSDRSTVSGRGAMKGGGGEGVGGRRQEGRATLGECSGLEGEAMWRYKCVRTAALALAMMCMVSIDLYIYLLLMYCIFIYMYI